MEQDQFLRLLEGLCKLPQEKEWLEFKENRAVPEEIGEYISALSNSARLSAESCGYMIWGVKDDTHKVVGTQFIPGSEKKGGEELEHWLVRLLSPRLDIKFHTGEFEGKKIVILEIPSASHTPVRFQGTEFVRIGSLKKKLKDYPEKERELWKVLNAYQFGSENAYESLDGDQVLQLLDYSQYFDLTGQPLPPNRENIFEKLKAEKLISECVDGWSITNLGAILFSKDLTAFERLSRKALRIIQYHGKNRVRTKSEDVRLKGYAVDFESMVQSVNSLLPQNEVIGQALRREVRMYPELAIRELVANALIHQDFTIAGAGPTIEIFEDRIEITNPGLPLVDTLRMMDEPPRSRNEIVAALMRRMNICEERGSGIDKVVFEVEFYQLPAPNFVQKDQSLVVTLYAYQALRDMDKDARIRACYQHACLKYVSHEQLTNATLRKRLNISKNNAGQATRIISDTLDIGLIQLSDPDNKSRKHVKYVPFWA